MKTKNSIPFATAFWLICIFCLFWLAGCAAAESNISRAASPTARQDTLPGRFAGNNIVIGLEYAILNNEKIVTAMAKTFAETGMTGMKHYAEAVEWGAMQKSPTAPIDYSTLDLFVGEYQKYGFTELTMCLKPHSKWGSKDIKLLRQKNASPKPQYRNLYANWVQSVVERYDADGMDDMPGLRWPIRYLEIGNEFSSYEPEPVEDYLETLKLAYEAAHRASDRILVGHAAFLTTPVYLNVADPGEYDTVWQNTKRNDKHHDLNDIRAILDRPDLFDFINLHNLGDPYEIEYQMKWLKYETGLRGYTKPVIISDTLPTSYVGWGPATRCKGGKLGLITPPTTEADRCRLAAFFTKLVNKDKRTLAWTRGFVAADHVQRTVIAAEQGIELINLAFVADIPWLTTKIFAAGAGISAWGGALLPNIKRGKIISKHPPFYAIQQIMQHLQGYESIRRVSYPDDQARIYEIKKGGGHFWVAWRDPKAVLLPEDGVPSLQIRFKTGTKKVVVEPVIIRVGQRSAKRNTVATPGGMLRTKLIHTPVYIFPGQ
jgi:hypothetical protein